MYDNFALTMVGLWLSICPTISPPTDRDVLKLSQQELDHIPQNAQLLIAIGTVVASLGMYFTPLPGMSTHAPMGSTTQARYSLLASSNPSIPLLQPRVLSTATFAQIS